ncbi:MAG: hypothetical protein RSD71_15490 [Flavobacterium sp.]
MQKNKFNTEIEPIYKEKAVFRNKWIFWCSICVTIISIIASIIAFNKSGAFKYIIWGTIQFLFFVILVSKHAKTIKALKILSTITLLYLASLYLIDALTLENKKLVFQQKDLKIVLILIVVYFGGDEYIEVRKIQTNKNPHNKNED